MESGVRNTATILSIATATPANYYLQSEYPDFYFSITKTDHMTELKNKFARICKNSGIRKRHMYLTEELIRKNPDFFCSEKVKPSLEARQEMVAREVPLLGMEAAEKAIKEWGRPVSDITHLVFATSSDNSSPTADLRLAKLLGLPTSVRRFFVYGHVCAGASAALRIAMDVAQSDPRARVLVVSCENTAISFEGPTPENVVLPAILADGAAALVVGGSATVVDGVERPLFEMTSAFDILIPDSETVVSTTLTSSGSVLSLSKSLPLYVEENIKTVMGKAFPGEEDWNSVFFALHPGGRAVLDRVETRLGLKPEKLRASRRVLEEYGNMLGSTVIFVLDELRRKSVEEGKPTTGDGNKWGVLVGLGPGIVVYTIVLRSVALN